MTASGLHNSYTEATPRTDEAMEQCSKLPTSDHRYGYMIGLAMDLERELAELRLAGPSGEALLAGASAEGPSTPQPVEARPDSGSVGPWKERVYKHPDTQKVLTNREEGYLDRLHDRCNVLRARIGDGYSSANFVNEWKQELSAFEWAITRLGATTLPLTKEKPCS